MSQYSQYFVWIGYGACFITGTWFVAWIWTCMSEALNVSNSVKELRELVIKVSNDVNRFTAYNDEMRDYLKEFMRTHPLPEKKK